MAPTSSASRAANPTYWADPVSARSASPPKVSSAVIATGPVCRYGEDTKGAAAIVATAPTASPVAGGMPARTA